MTDQQDQINLPDPPAQSLGIQVASEMGPSTASRTTYMSTTEIPAGIAAKPVLIPPGVPKWIRIANAVMGGILAASGGITAYADTLGGDRWASVVLGGIGVAQLVLADILTNLSNN